MDLRAEKAHLHERDGNQQGDKNRKPPIEKSLDQVPDRFTLQLVLLIGIINQNKGRQNGQGNNRKHTLQ